MKINLLRGITMDLIRIERVNDCDVVDSRLIAMEMGIQHKNFYQAIKDNQTDIEEAFGSICFEHFGYNKPLLSVYDLLGILSECCLYTQNRYQLGLSLIRLIENKIYPSLNNDEKKNVTWIIAGLKFELMRNIASSHQELGGIHPRFVENYKKLIPNSTLKQSYSINKQRPDFIVEIDGVDYPVECKITFKQRDIKQCLKYIRLWDVPYCFAVAQKFEASTHKLVRFISL